jgi:hypothetical protein
VSLMSEGPAVPASSSTVGTVFLDVSNLVADITSFGVFARNGSMASGVAKAALDDAEIDGLNSGVRINATRNF